MIEKSHYSIGGNEFSTKDALKKRCQTIISTLDDGEFVKNDDLIFLIGLFQHHDEWMIKSCKGVKGIKAQKNTYGTRGFLLVFSDETTDDISYMHAIKCLRGERTRNLLPQKLVDYKNAARSTITSDIRTFRDAQLALGIICPISNELVCRANCEVDHEPPLTFDKLLYDFTVDENINPLETVVGSQEGIVPYFENAEISSKWITYHRENAKLRLLSTIGHAQVSSPRIDWGPLINQKKLW